MKRKSESEFSIFSRTPRNDGVDILKRKRSKKGPQNDQSFKLQDGLDGEDNGGSPRMDCCNTEGASQKEQDQNRSVRIEDGSPARSASPIDRRLNDEKSQKVNLHLATWSSDATVDRHSDRFVLIRNASCKKKP